VPIPIVPVLHPLFLVLIPTRVYGQMWAIIRSLIARLTLPTEVGGGHPGRSVLDLGVLEIVGMVFTLRLGQRDAYSEPRSGASTAPD
jgi:hypothetical protein